MSRDRGPRLKKMRAVGVELPGLSRKSIERKPNPPGMREGQYKKKKSEFGTQLLEKQKLRFNYGVTEKYMRKLISESFRSREHSGHKLIELLESRLDNVVFKAGFAPTIPAARQLVSHNHILVDGKRVNIASFRVKAGQTITVTEKASKMPLIVANLEQPAIARPAWLSLNQEDNAVQMITVPDRDSLSFPLEIALVVEFYSRSIK